MQSFTIVALLCCVLVVSGAPAAKDIVTEQCLQQNHVANDILVKLYMPAEVKNIQADKNIKCFTNCLLQKNELVKDNVIQVERVVALNVAQGRAEATVRANLERCKALYTGSNTCDEAWTIFQCFNEDK